MTTSPDGFGAYMEARGLSESTTSLYRQAVRIYQAWATDQGVAVGQASAVRWLGSFPAMRTRAVYASALRQWFLWREAPLHIRVRAGQMLPHPPTRYEVRRIVTAAQGRDRLAVLTLAFAGLRLAELCALRWTALSPESSSLRVLGKGRRERVIGIARGLYEDLRAARGERRDGPVFEGRRRGRPVSGRTVEDLVQHLGALAGVELHPHKLRHFFASWRYATTLDVFGTAAALGHSNPQTTYGYVGVVERPPEIASMDDLYRWVTE